MNSTVSPGASKADLSFAHSLVDLDVPVFTARLDEAGAPHRPRWEQVKPSHEEVDKWRPGSALCAHTGVAFDVLDVDPRNGGWDSYQDLRATLGRDPDIYAAVRTRAGGMHFYVPRLELGTHHPASPRWPGIDLQGKGAMVFIPPTHRLDGDYTLRGASLDELASASRDEALLKLFRAPVVDESESTGRSSTTDLRAAVLKAPEGAQREALLSYVDELEKRYDREDVKFLLSDFLKSIPVYDKAHPWKERDLFAMLHRPGERIPDASASEMAELTETERELPPAVRKRLAMLKVDQAAHEALRLGNESLSSLSLAGYGLTLSEDVARGVPAVRWSVESLATMGAQVTLPSSRKTGKTTFLLNLCRSAGNGTPFLDRFDCTMDGNVGYINAEMLRADILGYCSRLGGGVWLDRVRMLHCREDGLRINLLSDSVCEELTSWCVQGEVEWLVADPWKNFCGWAGAGINDNDVILALSDRFRQISVEAHLSLVIIPMHTTQTPQEEGEERGKGAGELEDGADWLWRYTRIGEMSEPRKLSAEGRGPGIENLVVTWDEGTGLLSCAEGVSPRDIVRSSGADAALEALTLLLMDGRNRVKSGELQASMSGAKGDKIMAIRAAVNAGRILEDDEGRGRPTWYSLSLWIGIPVMKSCFGL